MPSRMHSISEFFGSPRVYETYSSVRRSSYDWMAVSYTHLDVYKRQIQSYDERLTLEYVSYTLGEPKNSEIECIREGITYSVPLYVKLRLREEDFIKDEDIYMGEIPMVTERGSFIINGAERVVVSQLHRSPGIAFEVAPHPNGKLLHLSLIHI